MNNFKALRCTLMIFMMEDKMAGEETRKLVWGGKLPVCFSLHPEEVRDVRRDVRIEPCYMMVSRITYFPSILEKVDSQFRRTAGADIHDGPWLEYKGEPLKWQYPVGVLYDMMVVSGETPWKIWVRYQNFPKDKVLQLRTKEEVKAHFTSKLKEADFLKHKGAVMDQFKQEEAESLWSGLVKDDFSLYWDVGRKLMLNMRGEQEAFNNTPFIIYTSERVIQRLMPPVKKIRASEEDSSCDVYNEENYTLCDLLQKFYPSAVAENVSTVRVHGIEVPLDTPLQWLSEHMCYPDSFVHIVVRNDS